MQYIPFPLRLNVTNSTHGGGRDYLVYVYIPSRSQLVSHISTAPVYIPHVN